MNNLEVPKPSSESDRLNPFAFPPETNTRFNLYFLAALMLAVYIGFHFWPVLSWIKPELFNQEAFYWEAPELLESPATPEWFWNAAKADMKAAVGGLVSTALCLPALILLISTAVYLSHPLRIRRKRQLHSPANEWEKSLQNQVTYLAEQVGLSAVPHTEVGGSLISQNARAYGAKHPFIVGLDGGTILLSRKKPEYFRALVLHELGHIVNKDIVRTYFARALQSTVLIIFILSILLNEGVMWLLIILNQTTPLLDPSKSGVSLDEPVNVRDIFSILLPVSQGIAITIILIFIFSSLLRVREFYADWRVVGYGYEEPLIGILKRLVVQAKRPRNILNRLHPTASSRMETLLKPRSLFKVNLDLPFFVGLLISLMLCILILVMLELAGRIGFLIMAFQSLVAAISSSIQSPFLFNIVSLLRLFFYFVMAGIVTFPVLWISYVLVGTLGLQIMKESLGNMVEGRRRLRDVLRLFLIAVIFASGFEIGLAVAPFALLSPVSKVILQEESPSLWWMMGWLSAVIIVTWLSLLYVDFFSRRWLGSHHSTSIPIWRRRFLNLAFAFLVFLLYLPLVLVRFFRFIETEGNRSAIDSLFWILMISSLIIFILLLLGTWIIMTVDRSTKRHRCPSCGYIYRRLNLQHINCESCGKPLAAWLFVV